MRFGRQRGLRRTEGVIPIVSQEERLGIAAMPPTPAVHRKLYARMPFAAAVELGNPAAAEGAPAATARVLAWNAARCVDVAASARFIQASGAEVVLLTEMDWGMARSGQLHTARELARRLAMGHAYSVEFLELGLGDEREKAAHAGESNAVGYHGAAILCRRPLTRARRIPLEGRGGWFDEARGQRRVGGRMALCAVTLFGSTEVVLCSVHLESESDPAERLREIELLLQEIDARYPDRPVVIGGDLNTFSVPRAELDDAASVRVREGEDAERFAHPVRHEPLFAYAEARGYEWRQSNVPGVPTHRQVEPGAAHPPMKLDWFLTRGVAVGGPRVLPAPAHGPQGALSDHDAILVTITAGGEPPREMS